MVKAIGISTFTEDLLTAYRYGAGNKSLAADDMEMSFINYYDGGN